MARVMEETKVSQNFTEHNQRAKCASNTGMPKCARMLLAHADGKITERVYRRPPKMAKPLR